ncbi:MAG: tRNA adenosine(34) deaminase TadA [Phycisphaerae bacterium]
MTNFDPDEYFMRQALRLAEDAFAANEVPVGAVVVHEEKVIGKGFNQRQMLHDPTAHAEILAITAAASAMGDWRLSNCTLYVTLEPCVMCAGAIVLARIDRVVYGAPDPKAGAVESLYNLLSDSRLNHRPQIRRGVLAEEASSLLTEFFRQQRAIGKK